MPFFEYYINLCCMHGCLLFPIFLYSLLSFQMPLSNKERQRLFRARKTAGPQARALFLVQKKERYCDLEVQISENEKLKFHP